MTQPALILAAHGAGDGSAANRFVCELAAALTATGRWSHVIAAFNRGTPEFADAIRRMSPGRVVVVPVMTSDGYFRDLVLPSVLRDCGGANQHEIHITPSLGSRRELIDIVENLAQTAAERFTVKTTDATLLVVGHGTRRHTRSGDTVRSACRALRRRSLFARVEAAFLDEPPLLEEYAANSEAAVLIAVPFLIGGGQHAQTDVPRRLGVDAGADAEMPIRADVGNRRIICTQPVGSHAAIRGVVESLATQGLLSTHASIEGGES